MTRIGLQEPPLENLGLGSSLDTLRFRFFLAEAARASVDSVRALVIGSHDDKMIPLTQHATIGGVRIEQLLDVARIARIVDQTRQAGTTIVGKLKTRGSFYAASHAIAEIVEAVVRDTQAIFPLSVRCRGHYGYDETTLALPCLVGTDGVERILQIDLDAREQAALDLCAAGVAAAMAEAG